MKKKVGDYFFLFLLAGTIIALDQWTKNIIRTNLTLGETWVPWEWLAPYARIVYWHNAGAAFGFGQNLSLLFTILPFLVVAVILVYYPQIPRHDWPLRVALGLQLGGAIGNLIDRLTIGLVTDFISIGKFAVFNVADSAISVGVAVLIIGMWIMERQQRSQVDSLQDPLSNPESPLTGEDFQGE